MQWKDDVSNDDIEAVNASSTTKIKHGSTKFRHPQATCYAWNKKRRKGQEKETRKKRRTDELKS